MAGWLAEWMAGWMDGRIDRELKVLVLMGSDR